MSYFSSPYQIVIGNMHSRHGKGVKCFLYLRDISLATQTSLQSFIHKQFLLKPYGAVQYSFYVGIHRCWFRFFVDQEADKPVSCVHITVQLKLQGDSSQFSPLIEFP